MTIRNSIVLALAMAAASFAAGLDCQHAQPSGSREGTIDFVVRQGEGRAPATAHGSFDVRGLDNDEHTHVGIGNGTPRTLHVRLPAGAYTVTWIPTLPVDATSPAPSELTGDESAAEWPKIVVVGRDSASVVDVLVRTGARCEAPLQLASVSSGSAF
jgi:hypothetical protein